jgi:imidazole glycerol-phosphate synthase subunit HisF
MPKIRLIPVILLKNGRVVQSKRFKRHQILGTPSVIVSRLSNWFADELVFLDISRDGNYCLNRDDLNFNNNNSIVDIIEEVSNNSFMPLTVGGGVRTVADVETRLAAGADKVVINTQAIQEPDFINKCAKIFGSQCIVVSIDAKVKDDSWEVYKNYGRDPTGVSPVDFARKMQDYGAGEILINSIDNDGVGNGYDTKLVSSVVKSVSIPVIALGGAGKPEHFSTCINESRPNAVAAANIFQYTENSYFNINSFLYNNSFNVRQPNLETIFEAGDS